MGTAAPMRALTGRVPGPLSPPAGTTSLRLSSPTRSPLHARQNTGGGRERRNEGGHVQPPVLAVSVDDRRGGDGQPDRQTPGAKEQVGQLVVAACLQGGDEGVALLLDEEVGREEDDDAGERQQVQEKKRAGHDHHRRWSARPGRAAGQSTSRDTLL